MEIRKTFKRGESLESIAAAVRSMADAVTGDGGEGELLRAVRVTVSTIGGVIPRAAVKEVLDGLGVGDAIEAVVEFLDYRQFDKKKPIKTVAALARLVKQFKGRPDGLTAAVEESIAQGWTGLFLRDEKFKKDGRKLERGVSDGGAW